MSALKRMRLALGVRLFHFGVASSGRAARVAGVGRADLLEILSSRGIPLDGNVSDVAHDVEVIHAWLHKNRKQAGM